MDTALTKSEIHINTETFSETDSTKSNGYEGLINHFFYTMSPNNRTVYVSNNKESKSIDANQEITSVKQLSFESELCAYYIVKANIVNTETTQEEPYKYLVFSYKK